jgi:hypothetical protein
MAKQKTTKPTKASKTTKVTAKVPSAESPKKTFAGSLPVFARM